MQASVVQGGVGGHGFATLSVLLFPFMHGLFVLFELLTGCDNELVCEATQFNGFLTEDVGGLLTIEEQAVGPYEIEVLAKFTQTLVVCGDKLGTDGGEVHGTFDDVLVAVDALDGLEKDVIVVLLAESVEHFAAAVFEAFCKGWRTLPAVTGSVGGAAAATGRRRLLSDGGGGVDG